MDKELNKTFLICLIFLMFFSLSHIFVPATFRGVEFNNGDFKTHLEMAQNPSFNPTYVPFFRLVSAPFSFNSNAFFFFGIILVIFCPPLYFYLLFKKSFPTILYFATGLPYRIILGFFLPMFFAMFFLVPFLLTKNRGIKLGLLIFSLFLHAQAFNLFLACWVVQEIYYFLKSKPFLPLIFCGKPINEKIESISPIQAVSPNTVPTGPLNLGLAIRFFLKDLNLILIFYSIKGFILKKRIDIILVGAIIVMGSFFVYARAIYALCLLSIIGLSHYFLKNKFLNYQWLVIFVCILINLIDFIFEAFLAPMGFC